MSRCFPFPPPGCEKLLSDKYDALIQSIKRKRQDRERRKQEKKERNKLDKKIQKQLLINQEIESKTNVEMERHYQEEDGFLGEGSGLTQEHRTDSSHNSSGNKRKRYISSNLDDTTMCGMRRLPPLVELKDPQEVAINREQPPCSTEMTGNNASCITNIMQSSSISGTGRRSQVAPARDCSKAATDSGPSSRIMQQPFSISGRRTQVAPARDSSFNAFADGNGPCHRLSQFSCSVSVRTEVPSQDCSNSKAAATDADVICKSNSPSDEQSSLRQVIENWVPPPIQFHPTESEDLDWLFSNRQTKRCKATDVASCNEVVVSNTLPRAQYLPEAAIYALPYTVVL